MGAAAELLGHLSSEVRSHSKVGILSTLRILGDCQPV